MIFINIKVFNLMEGAAKAEGLTVIIDVFRAFSVACFLFASDAKKIIAVKDLETAYKIKEDNPDVILIGEREGKKQPGFDFGNSPSAIKNIDCSNKTIVHATSSGTRGIVNARKADHIITGSFVNAGAIIEYIRKKNPEKVSLVAMGWAGRKPSDEDIFCAEYIKKILLNPVLEKGFNFQEIINKLKKGSGKRFFNPERTESPEEDFRLCLLLNKFDFIIEVESNDNKKALLKKKMIFS